MALSASSLPSKSQIFVDLGSRKTAGALHSLALMGRRIRRIKSALIYTSAPIVDIHSKLMHKSKVSAATIVGIFHMLSQMPKLTTVTIDLDMQWGSLGGLPLSALVALLNGAKHLSTLQLVQLDFTLSTKEEWKLLAKAVHKHKHLKDVAVIDCHGEQMSSLVGLFAKEAQSLETLQIHRSTIDSKAIARFSSPLFHPRLRSLQLDEIAGLTDKDIHILCMNLEDANCTISDLGISSSILTDSAGNRLVNMLCINNSLRRVVLHLDCELPFIAEGLLANTTLRELDLRCYGDDDAVSSMVQQIASALLNSPLQTLRLRMELEPWEFQQEVVSAFAEMMSRNINTSLQHLFLDDGVHPYLLNDQLNYQLKLNQCGYSRFVRSTNRVSTDKWMRALESAGDDTTVLFTILRNCPSLICGASKARDLDIQVSNTSNKWHRYGITRRALSKIPSLPGSYRIMALQKNSVFSLAA